VREALALLGTEHKAATVKLHAEDLAVVETALREEHAALQVNWMADAQVERGGCLVESAGTVVDGRLPARWRRALAQLGLDAPWQQEDGDA
jgi:flagellar assembly protein FliH